ncbi:NADP-dependent oxidoreductase [Motiliproteus sediminis]|uniref:NADP-dependent oxidoreductase n=1 Tax=Motiliproteus sediminis TaxID=1468178 RepID=UPI001AF025BB|nr:NADP-dependent oxidoreductase [Motiliproteus sediminis]
MKAVRLHQFALQDALRVEQLAETLPGPGELRVRIAAAGVNPIDWKTCAGGGAAPFIGELPWIPGWECAGVVDAVGEGVSGWQRGDRAMGLLNFPQAGNCYAEQVCAPADQWAEVPPPVSLVDAGGLPLAGLTAWQALFEQAGLQPGERVLILAAAGGVGHLALQLARAHGAIPIGTASATNHPWLTELGCQQCIDYHQPDALSQLEPVAVLIDCVGGDSAIAALTAVAAGGRVVTLPTITADQVIAAGIEQGLQVTGMRVRPDAKQLEQLAQLAAEDRLKLRVECCFELDQVAKAHALSQSGHAQGKLLLTP